jgi:hypothetical protein
MKLLKRRAAQDGLADDDVVPGQDLALRVEADLGAVHVHGAVVAALDVVLAAPQRAHRGRQPGAARGLGHIAGFHHVVAGGNRAAAETAAGHLHVHLDVLRRHAQRLGRGQRVQARHLRAQPEFGLGVCALPAELHGAVQRLHRRMRQVGEDKLGADLFRRRSELADVVVVLERAGFLRQRRGSWPVAARCRPSRRRWCPIRP